MKLASLVCALAACAEPGAPTTDGDVRPGCERPAVTDDWLSGRMETDLAALASMPRETVPQRQVARQYLLGQLTGLGAWSVTTQDYPGGSNVVATLPPPASGPGEILVGAHFDTVAGSPGANDNGSGTVVVLALAHYLTGVPCRSAPVTVVLFDQEEPGLFGSRAFAAQRSPATVRAVHTIDQVAWDSDGDHRFEIESPTPALAAEYRAAAQIVGVPVTVTSTMGTDHESFRDAGFAAVGLTEEYTSGDTSPFRHLPGDTVATVNAPYLTLAARLAIQVVVQEAAP